MPNERVEAYIFVNGKEFRVRFDDERLYVRFHDFVARGQRALHLCFLDSGKRLWVRPASVDAMIRVGE